jgi:hypothetical protein
VAITAREIVSGIGVEEVSALRLKDGIEAGYKHVGRDPSQQHLVDLG